MTAKHYPLRACPACHGTIRRAPSESWPSYHKKTACSMKCAAQLREARERNKVSAAQALGQALMGWKAAA
ncbi:MAG: hypothetical protein K8H84_07250 [Sulfuricella denitrificans]|nr:hypothetical protein [Sulfuricella denitrificans]